MTPLGLMHQMWAVPGITDREAVDTAVAEFRAAETLGFDSVWIGEHHTVQRGSAYYGRIPATEIFLAHIAAQTSRIAVGTGVKILSTASALRAAEEISLLHLLTGGRAEFGLGLGVTRPGDPVSREEKAARYRATLADILRLLSGDRTTGLPELSPKPILGLRERLWVAARDAETVEFAAEQGLNFIVGQAEIAVRQAEHVARYRAAGGSGQVRGVRIAHVAETAADAAAQSEAAVEIYFGQMAGKSYHKEAVDLGLLPPQALSAAERRSQVSFHAGTPEQVAADLNDYAAQVGIDRLDVMAQLPGLATDAVQRSLRLLQGAVRPRLDPSAWARYARPPTVTSQGATSQEDAAF